MHIKIAERLKPFSHKPGTSLLLPGSSLSLSVYPTRLFIIDFEKNPYRIIADIHFELEGPVEDFTVVQELEKGCVRVFGRSNEGYFRYFVQSLENKAGFALTLEKGPSNGIKLSCSGAWMSEKTRQILPKEKIVISKQSNEEGGFYFPSGMERLSLGNHKKQDWELVQRRLSFTEIFPVWHHLGQMIPESTATALTGTALLLDECLTAIQANAPEKILEPFRKLFLAGFSGILSPQLMDSNFYGIKGIDIDFSLVNENKVSSLILLTEGAKLIKSLFVKEEGQNISILPALPPEFHCGRFLQIKCAKQGILSIEWTKKSIRRMVFSASEDQLVSFIFNDGEKSCRLRTSYKDRGVVYVPGSPVDILAGQSYWFDNFVS